MTSDIESSKRSSIEQEDPPGDKKQTSTNSRDHIMSVKEEPVINKPKPTLMQRLYARVPPYQLTRIIVKASISLLIAMLFVFIDSLRNAIGSASVLVPIASLLYFPFRPIGVQLEASIHGLFGALLGSAWCFLGMYCASLARDPSIASPVQPGASGVLAVFMLIGLFIVSYLRVKFVQAICGTTFASMIVAFGLTQAAITPTFQPIVIFTFLKPIAMATGITLFVDVFLWPDDSITKYMGVLNKSLTEYNRFFKEHANAFLLQSPSKTDMTLPSLHARLQNSVLALIDSKREVNREILFNKLAHRDISEITRLVKIMRSPLHGIGISLISKSERLSGYSIDAYKDQASDEQQKFFAHLSELRKASQELTDTCAFTLEKCTERLMKYAGKPRSLKSTLLWPFPRVFLSDYRAQPPVHGDQEEDLMTKLDEKMDYFRTQSRKCSRIYVEPDSKLFEEQFNSLLQLIYLFQFNLVEHANHLRTLVTLVENIEQKRRKRRLWLPTIGLKKFFRSTTMDTGLGGQVGAQGNADPLNVTADNNSAELTLTITRQDEDMKHLTGHQHKGGVYPRDPDVNPPATRFEHFFYTLNRYTRWMHSLEAIFALKTSIGFVLLSLPAYLPQSSGWFFAWRGQWATVTLMMWMIPMAGMFTYSVILRLLGTILGGVLSIIVFQIARGNPYGLAVLVFFVMWPLYYVFFTNPTINMMVIMIQMTMLMVISYAYQYTLSGAIIHDSVQVVAGKRILLVCIGVLASAILSMIPKPVTGRVELRKRISKTLRDMSKLYGILVGDILISSNHDHEGPTPGQQKAYRKLALGIRRQIADERSYLKMAKLEPPLTGRFPIEVYTELVEKIDNMADLLQGMAYSSHAVDKAWRRSLVQVINQERKEFLASILSIMKLLSSTLASKMALPPFMLSPLELREKLSRDMTEAIAHCPEKLDNETFPGYCSFAVNSFRFSGELDKVIECVEKLVGVEDPEQWLLLHA